MTDGYYGDINSFVEQKLEELSEKTDLTESEIEAIYRRKLDEFKEKKPEAVSDITEDHLRRVVVNATRGHVFKGRGFSTEPSQEEKQDDDTVTETHI